MQEIGARPAETVKLPDFEWSPPRHTIHPYSDIVSECFWHIIWRYIWHKYTVTFYLTFFLTFYLAFFLTYFLYVMYSDIIWHSFWDSIWHIILTFFLPCHTFWHSFWHPFRHSVWHSIWPSLWLALHSIRCWRFGVRAQAHSTASNLEFGSRRPPLQPELAGCKTRQKEGGGEDNKEQEKEEEEKKKITLLRVIPTMTFQNSLLTPLLSEAFVTGLLPKVEMSLSTPVTLSSVQTDCFKLCHLQSKKWHCPGHSTTHARVCK